jgi:hypothetical protein
MNLFEVAKEVSDGLTGIQFAASQLAPSLDLGASIPLAKIDK